MSCCLVLFSLVFQISLLFSNIMITILKIQIKFFVTFKLGILSMVHNIHLSLVFLMILMTIWNVLSGSKYLCSHTLRKITKFHPSQHLPAQSYNHNWRFNFKIWQNFVGIKFFLTFVGGINLYGGVKIIWGE